MLNKAVVDDFVKTIKHGRVVLDEMLEIFLPLTARKAGQTREMSMARTSLQQGRNWLGETLGALGQDYPYPDSIKPENEKIEPPTDKNEGPSSTSRLEEEEDQSAITLIKRRRLELSIFRQSLYAIHQQLPADQRCLGPQRTLELALIHFKEAGHALGHQLNREFEEQQAAARKHEKTPDAEAPANNSVASWNSASKPQASAPAEPSKNTSNAPAASAENLLPSDSNPDSTSPAAVPTPEPSNPSAEPSDQKAATTTTAADSPTASSTESSPTSAGESQPESSASTSSEPTPSASMDEEKPASSNEEPTASSTESAAATTPTSPNDPADSGFALLGLGEPLPPVTGTDDAGTDHPATPSKKHKNRR